MLQSFKHIEKEHFGLPKFECDICNVIYYHEVDLNEHKETFHGVQSSSLKLTGKKPYECEQCQESFGEKELFENHIESVHEGKKSYKCSKDNMQLHKIPKPSEAFYQTSSSDEDENTGNLLALWFEHYLVLRI